jgi:hypothetical protein
MTTPTASRRAEVAVNLGALGGTRTTSLLIRSQMLYPLSYERWRVTVYGNPRPACASRVLPSAALATVQVGPGRDQDPDVPGKAPELIWKTGQPISVRHRTLSGVSPWPTR